MSKKRPYHHWVPRPLLRALSADGKSVVQYSRRVGEAACKEASIKRAAASQDSFSKDVEAVLSSIEGAAAPAIKAFQRMMRPLAIDSVSKSIVACYLAGFLWYRSPRVRATQLAGVTKPELMNWGRDEARAMAAVSDEARQLYLERLPQVAEEMAADPNRLMAGHWWAGNMARWTLYSMSWTVLHCPKPIVAIPDCGMIHQGELALLNEAAELYLPLSADRILVASWRGAPGLVQYAHATPAHVGKINRMGYGLASGAHGLAPVAGHSSGVANHKGAPGAHRASGHMPMVRRRPAHADERQLPPRRLGAGAHEAGEPNQELVADVHHRAYAPRHTSAWGDADLSFRGRLLVRSRARREFHATVAGRGGCAASQAERGKKWHKQMHPGAETSRQINEMLDFIGGEGGIRTLDGLAPIHTFQACSFSRSDTSPKEAAYQPCPGTRYQCCRCSLPGLTGFTPISSRGTGTAATERGV